MNNFFIPNKGELLQLYYVHINKSAGVLHYTLFFSFFKQISPTTRFHPGQNPPRSRCIPLQFGGKGWLPRHSLLAPACFAAPAALELSSVGFLQKEHALCLVRLFNMSTKQRQRH